MRPRLREQEECCHTLSYMVEALFLATWLPQTGEQMDRMHTNDEVHEQSCKIVGIRRASVCEPDPVAKDSAQFRLDRIECRPLTDRTKILVARQFRQDPAHEIEHVRPRRPTTKRADK